MLLVSKTTITPKTGFDLFFVGIAENGRVVYHCKESAMADNEAIFG